MVVMIKEAHETMLRWLKAIDPPADDEDILAYLVAVTSVLEVWHHAVAMVDDEQNG
jgi:hypothetical protein